MAKPLRIFGNTIDIGSARTIITKSLLKGETIDVGYKDTNPWKPNSYKFASTDIIVGGTMAGISGKWDKAHLNNALRLWGEQKQNTYDAILAWWKIHKYDYVVKPKPPVVPPTPPPPAVVPAHIILEDIESADPSGSAIIINKREHTDIYGYVFDSRDSVERLEVLMDNGKSLGACILRLALTTQASKNLFKEKYSSTDINYAFHFNLDMTDTMFEDNIEYTLHFMVTKAGGIKYEMAKKYKFKIINTVKPPFNVPYPTYSSKAEVVSKYSYFFGVDKVKLSNRLIKQNCCFISQDISIGQLEVGEFIQLDTEYITGDQSSIEFYIIDGSMEKPIMPIVDTIISDEKVFYGLPSRFSIDESLKPEVKRNGMLVDLTFSQAKQLNDALYTVSYKPVESYDYIALNSTIKVKVVMRLYDKNNKVPYISKMKIRKFGGNGLWKEDVSII
jgi:hypothetical protein